MGFSYQLNALTEEELAKDAKEEFGETKNLMEVDLLFYSLLSLLAVSKLPQQDLLDSASVDMPVRKYKCILKKNMRRKNKNIFICHTSIVSKAIHYVPCQHP